MKEIVRLLAVFFIFCNYNCSGQVFSYKNVPSKYLGRIGITASERLAIKKGLKAPYSLENALPKNYVKDGSVDYTEIIQNAIAKKRTVIFPNFPILISDKGLTISSNSVLYFQEKSKIVLKANANTHYEMIRIHDVDNVKVYFPNIVGDRYSHTGTTGEWGMGISIRGTNNILIYGAKVEKCWGDGIYLGISPVTNSVINNNVSIKKSFVDDNRRNGVSIISAQNSVFENFVTANTFGTAPNAGIDIEPDASTDIIKNLRFTNVTAFNNDVHGFLFVLSNLYGKDQNIGQVSLNNFTSDQSQFGISLKIGRVDPKHLGKPSGTISLNNPILVNYTRQPILSYPENDKNTFSVKVQSQSATERSTFSGFTKSSQNIIISK